MLVFQCFVRLAHVRSGCVIALPSLVWPVLRAGSEKAKTERARARMKPLTPDYRCIYFLHHRNLGMGGTETPFRAEPHTAWATAWVPPVPPPGLALPARLLSLSCVREFSKVISKWSGREVQWQRGTFEVTALRCKVTTGCFNFYFITKFSLL